MTGEFALIERLLQQVSAPTPPELILGPGDDCALIAAPATPEVWAITTDMLVEGTHFLATDTPHELGWKTLAVNLSDLAAMGARPRYITLAAALHTEDNTSGWVDEFFSGFQDCAQRFNVTLLGGDTTHGRQRCFCVTAWGTVPAAQALRRDGAQADDDIWVSGTPGLAALGLHYKLHQHPLPDALVGAVSSALHEPQPRIALGQALVGIAHSCLDVSDGLLQDLGHIAKASHISATLYATALPPPPDGITTEHWLPCVLSGGDDYELLFTAPPSARATLLTYAEQLALPLHRIGQMCSDGEAGSIRLLDAQQNPIPLHGISQGYDHFA